MVVIIYNKKINILSNIYLMKYIFACYKKNGLKREGFLWGVGMR